MLYLIFKPMNNKLTSEQGDNKNNNYFTTYYYQFDKAFLYFILPFSIFSLIGTIIGSSSYYQLSPFIASPIGTLESSSQWIHSCTELSGKTSYLIADCIFAIFTYLVNGIIFAAFYFFYYKNNTVRGGPKTIKFSFFEFKTLWNTEKKSNFLLFFLTVLSLAFVFNIIGNLSFYLDWDRPMKWNKFHFLYKVETLKSIF